MDSYTHRQQLLHRLQTVGHGLPHVVKRSPGLRSFILIALNAGGCLLLLSPLLIVAGLSITASLIAGSIQGPLDWFLIELCVASGLAAAWICYQLYTMRPVPADGVTLEAHREPRLFSMLERRLTHFGLRPFDVVQLATHTSLKVLAIPRWPLPLRHSYTLSIGAPLLFFISEPQFRLALAGAIAASARSRRSATGWALQAVRDWPVIIYTMQRHSGLASRLLLPAIRWIAAGNSALGYSPGADLPKEQAQWILDHSDEQTTRELLSSQVLATSFVTSQYWPMMLKGADHCPQPVVRPFSHFDLLLKGTFTADTARRWLLRAQTGYGHAQHKLQDMLAELRLDFLQSPTLPEHNAFEGIFETTDILKDLDQFWRERIAAEWQHRHSEFQAQKTRFEQLQKSSQQQDLRGDSAINFVRLARKFLDKQQAISVFRKIYRANPDDAAVCFTCGEAMLAAGHSLEGCDAMQRASELDSALANRAHALINQHKQGWMNHDLARSA